jgi:hypothetical protein
VRSAYGGVHVGIRRQPDHDLRPSRLKARISVTSGEPLHAKRPGEALGCSLRSEGNVERQLKK